MAAEQKEWLLTTWPKLISPLKQNKIECFVIVGNGDVSKNYPIHLQHEFNKLYKMINCKRMKLSNDLEIVGYPFVPFSYSSLKDFEKFDMSPSICPSEWKDSNLIRKLKGQYTTSAYHSNTQRKSFDKNEKMEKEDWHKVAYDQKREENDSIQIDLKDEIFTKNAKKTIYVFHSPPYDTIADVTTRKEHVGSVAVRNFIEKSQPFLTLHGHIHETVLMSSRYCQKIGESILLCSGNDPLYDDGHPSGDDLYILDIDVNDPSSAKRIRL
eukprot:TRINITY_DN1510_c0_g1_i2.p1 TRINITY_DN1510_c0_g1~~TRINITY_DN1510_c0_g1_i2.p1  ORF type:complete len:268 (+),score=54.69 TRINITY_DN1510_c0_g1_i2:235-1038(+)